VCLLIWRLISCSLCAWGVSGTHMYQFISSK
jgi:hypothetical protein